MAPRVTPQFEAGGRRGDEVASRSMSESLLTKLDQEGVVEHVSDRGHRAVVRARCSREDPGESDAEGRPVALELASTLRSARTCRRGAYLLIAFTASRSRRGRWPARHAWLAGL